MNIEWNILKIECKISENNLSNVVYKVHWECVITEFVNNQTYYSGVSASTNLSSPDPDNFILYESLTEEQVVVWLLDSIGDPAVQELYVDLIKSLNEQITPTIVSLALPWKPTPEPITSE
jgi:hypothetical protein